MHTHTQHTHTQSYTCIHLEYWATHHICTVFNYGVVKHTVPSGGENQCGAMVSASVSFSVGSPLPASLDKSTSPGSTG